MWNRTLAALAGVLTLTLLVPANVHALDVGVTLRVHATTTFPFDEPSFSAACALSVPAGSNGSVVLDAAASADCIEAWTFEATDFGRFVDGITGPGETEATDGRNTSSAQFVCGALGLGVTGPKFWSFWAFLVNDSPSAVGIDDYDATAGDVLEFYYLVDTCTFAVTLGFFTAGGPHADSPVPLEGDANTDPGSF